MINLNRAGLRAQSYGIMLNTLKVGLNILITSSRESFQFPYIPDSMTYIFSHLNISKLIIVSHIYCLQSSDQWCSFIVSSCAKNKISNMKAYWMDSSYLVESSENNSGVLFHYYTILLRSQKAILCGKTQSLMTQIQKNLKVKIF